MALTVTLAQFAAAYSDTVSIKCEAIDYPLRRQPNVILLPSNTYVTIDLNRSKQNISLSVVIDEDITELFVDTVTGGPFQVGEILMTSNDPAGTRAAWNAGVIPARGTDVTCTVVSGLPSLAAPTTLFVSGLGHGDDDFFVNNEPLVGQTSAATCLVNQPLASMHRWEQIARSWSLQGNMTLVTPNASYTVRMENFQLNQQSGRDRIYTGRVDFVKVV